jgi:hypothetical protein
VRVTISVNRKIGQPNYGSEGAGCELTLDLSEQNVSTNPASLIDECRRGYALCEQVVSEQLAQHQVEPPAAPARDRLPSQARPPSEPEPDRRPPRRGGYDRGHGPDGAARFKTDGFPRTGRELVPWSRKREESGENPGLFKRLVAYGRAVGYPDRMTEWNRDEVNTAVNAVIGEQYDDDPEPAPAGRNGHGNGYTR